MTKKTISDNAVLAAGYSDLARQYLDGSLHTPSMYGRETGVTQVFVKSITSAADAGDVTVATSHTGVILKSITVRTATGTCVDLGNIGVYAGAGKVLTLIDTTAGDVSNLNAVDKQVSWSGNVYLADTKTVIITLTNDGSGSTAQDFSVVLEYISVSNDAYMD